MPHALSIPQFRLQVVHALAQPGATLRGVAQQFHFSEPTVRRWRDRYRCHGLAGLQDRSRRPHSSSQQLPRRWHEELLGLRRKHPRWGAAKLRTLLRELHPRTRRLPSLRSLERWLRAAQLTRRAKVRARRGPALPRPALTAGRRPNDVWTLDFKGWFRTGDGRLCHALTVRDLASRFVLLVRIVPELSDAAVRPLLRSLFRRCGCPRVIRVDNGAPFAGAGALNLTTLSVWWICADLQVEFTRRAKPQDNGAHEQMHRVLKADTASPPAPTLRAQQRRFDRWLEEYNWLRPHAALGQRRPAEVYRVSTRPWPEPPPRQFDYPASWTTRRVRNRGSIKLDGRLRFIGRAFVGRLIGLKPVEAEHAEVYLGKLCIGTLHPADQTGLRPCTYRSRPPAEQVPGDA